MIMEEYWAVPTDTGATNRIMAHMMTPAAMATAL